MFFGMSDQTSKETNLVFFQCRAQKRLKTTSTEVALESSKPLIILASPVKGAVDVAMHRKGKRSAIPEFPLSQQELKIPLIILEARD